MQLYTELRARPGAFLLYCAGEQAERTASSQAVSSWDSVYWLAILSRRASRESHTVQRKGVAR
jgi:hypothetical protein